MSEDHTFCTSVLDAIQDETSDPTEQAEMLADILERNGARRAFARWIIARRQGTVSVPLKGTVS